MRFKLFSHLFIYGLLMRYEWLFRIVWGLLPILKSVHRIRFLILIRCIDNFPKTTKNVLFTFIYQILNKLLFIFLINLIIFNVILIFLKIFYICIWFLNFHFCLCCLHISSSVAISMPLHAFKPIQYHTTLFFSIA